MIQPLKIFESVGESDYYRQISAQNIQNGLGVLHFPESYVPAFEFVVGDDVTLGDNFTPAIWWVDAATELQYDITSQLTLVKNQIDGDVNLILTHKNGQQVSGVTGRVVYFKIICTGTEANKTWYTDTVHYYEDAISIPPDTTVIDGGFDSVLKLSRYVADGGFNSVNN